jgi:UDP-glucose 4-epimerase
MSYKVIVTGGTGYIGSHTLIELLANGYEVVSIDNYSRSDEHSLDRIEEVSGHRVINYDVDLCDLKELRKVFSAHRDARGVIHFAAFKSVPESVDDPLLYYRNNLNSLNNMLQCSADYGIEDFVFSSSCSVYGNIETMPVNEDSPLPPPESPYAFTKQIGERSIQDVATQSQTRFILLRYFNPVGAHESGKIGEVPIGRPQNLVPNITRSAIGLQGALKVFGDDYDTRDGSCIRDYVHVMDIASGHVKALEFLAEGKQRSNCEVFNLGSGNGVTVLELLKAFEKVSGVDLNYEIAPRRPGDVITIYSDNSRAIQELGWQPTRDIESMMASAWAWEVTMKEQKEASEKRLEGW